MPPSPSPLRTRGLILRLASGRMAPRLRRERRTPHSRTPHARRKAELLQLDLHPHALRLAIGRVLPTQHTALC
jgi:hypothetical protein